MKKGKGLKSESQKTVISLINILEINNCKPVLARNYENFPNFSNDLDLFVDNNSEINNYFCSVAKNLSWDNLTKCEHFSIYRNKVFNITAYKFLKLNPPQTLHVDPWLEA